MVTLDVGSILFIQFGIVTKGRLNRDFNVFFSCPGTLEIKNFGLKVLATFSVACSAGKCRCSFLGFLCPPQGFYGRRGFEINEEAGGNLLWCGYHSLLCPG